MPGRFRLLGAHSAVGEAGVANSGCTGCQSRASHAKGSAVRESAAHGRASRRETSRLTQSEPLLSPVSQQLIAD